MAKGVKIFPRGKKFRDNFDNIFKKDDSQDYYRNIIERCEKKKEKTYDKNE